MRTYGFLILVLAILSLNVFAEEDSKQQVFPKKVEVDKNHDGTADHFEFFENGKIIKMEEDSDYDGKMDEWVHYLDGRPSKSERDTNADGKPDTWVSY